MDSRGNQIEKHGRQRPPISRRSCDHCRARKIGCDRKTPCSNCASARLECVHSAKAPSTPTPRHRVLLTEQYEKKIDCIVRDLADIKQLLQKPPEISKSDVLSLTRNESQVLPHHRPKHLDLQRQSLSLRPGFKLEKTTHIVNFIECVADFPDPTCLGADSQALVLSLRRTAKALESPELMDTGVESLHQRFDGKDGMSMPPQEAAVSVLRWARETQQHLRIAWLFDILPLQRFSDICQKIYFAVDDYGESDIILANGCLEHLFNAHAQITGTTESRDHGIKCQTNVQEATERLPLNFPASTDVIAGLVLSAINASEHRQVETAWTLILNAANLCQRLGLHRRQHVEAHDDSSTAQHRLFGTVYTLELALSLRTGRLPTSRPESQVPCGSQASRLERLSALHAQVKAAVMGTSRGGTGDFSKFTDKLNDLSHETRASLTQTTAMGATTLLYRQSEILVQSSLLGLILQTQASTLGIGFPAQDSGTGVSAARNIMAAYCQYLARPGGYPATIKASRDWFLHNTPFIAFKVVFSHAVQTFSVDDLHQLEAFALSVDAFDVGAKSNPHSSQIYQLLCKAVRVTVQGGASAQKAQEALSDSSRRLRLPALQDDDAHAAETGAFASLEDEGMLLVDNAVMEFGDWWTLEENMDLASPETTGATIHGQP